MVVVNAKGPLREEIPNECTLIDLDCGRTRHAFFRLMLYFLSEKPDIVISSQTHLNLLVICIRMLIGFPRHLIVREHITFNKEFFKNKRLLERMRPWIIQHCYPFASKVVAVSKSSADSIHLFTKLNKEVHVIQNGLNLNLIRQKANELQNHQWLNNSSVKLIIGIGRLTHQKDFSTLLRAFYQLKNPQNYRLLILGEGAELTSLKSLAEELNIQDYVDFPGFIHNPYPFLASANIFVLPSRWEGFANVVIEALACGIPIVATDCPGGPADILAEKSFSRIIPMEDSRAMARSIEELLACKNEKASIINYSEEFSIENVAQKYINLINGL